MEPAVKSSRLRIQPADEMLIEQARGGQLEAYEEIFHRYGRLVYEYAFLMTGNVRIAEKVLLKSFVRFYRCLLFYRFQHKVLAELFKISSGLIKQAAREGDIPDFSQDADFSSRWQRLSFEDRAVMILGKVYGLNVGALGWILKQRPSRIIDRLEGMGSWDLAEITWPQVELPSSDYRVVLRSRIQRLRAEKKSYLLFSLLALLLVFGVAIYGRLSPYIFSSLKTKTSRPSPDVASTTKRPDRAGQLEYQASEIALQKFQLGRELLFLSESSFAEESFVFIAGRGKVLAIDYELFNAPSYAGLQFILRPVDLSMYASFSFEICGDAKIGVPDTVLVQFENEEAGVVKENVVSVSEQWNEVKLPLEFEKSKVIDKVAFLFKDPAVDLQKSGRVYIDKIVLTEKLK